MPVKSACSHCGHVYTLADEYLGKQVRCKQCQKPFVVAVTAVTAVPPRPVVEAQVVVPAVEEPVLVRRRPAAVQDEDDDDDFEDPRPRRGKRRRKSSEAPVGLILGAIAVGFLLLGGVIV